MRDYGCDKPDLRIPLKLVEISDLGMQMKNLRFLPSLLKIIIQELLH
jgi:aspartyl-tRNA synthetase